METMDTAIFYKGAVAYEESKSRDEYMLKMSEFNRNEALIIWYALDAWLDLYGHE